MKRTISAVQARKQFGELLDSVHYRRDEIVIERAGKPMAVVIPPERYQSLEQRRERVFELIERTRERNKDVPFEVVQREVERAIREVRAGYSRKGRKRSR